MRFPAFATRSALLLCVIALLSPGGAVATGSQGGKVDARNLGDGRLERVIVRWQPGRAPNTAADRTARLGAALPGVRRAASVSADTAAYWVPAARNRTTALASLHALAAVDGVAEVAPDTRLTADLTPNDTYYAAYQSDLFGAYGIDAPPAWDVTTGSAAVTVAVIDTGITVHSELSANVLPGYDFIEDVETANDGDGRDADASDPGDWVSNGDATSNCPASDSSWHGTHVAGTIAARGNNGAGVAGIAWTTKILPVRVLGKCGGWTSDIDAAIRWAAGGSVPGVPVNPYPARVLNLSLGGPIACDSATQSAIDDAIAHNAMVVVAAGNADANLADFSPAGCAGVVAVTATTSSGTRASFSNYGAGATIAAPGVNILSTWNSGTTSPSAQAYGQMSGTSMAAPHVAGVAALALAVDPALSASDLRALLVSEARPFAPDGSPSGCAALGCGAGIVDAGLVVAAAAGGAPRPTPTPTPTPEPTATPPPADTTPPAVTSFVSMGPSPTSAAAVAYSLGFSEPVSGLAASDVVISGSASGCVVGPISGTSRSYTVSVTGCGTGTLSIVLRAGAVRDAAGNAGPTSDRTSPTIVIDRSAPTATTAPLRLRTNSRVTATSLPVQLIWSGADAGTGIASYEVARSVDGGSTWTLIASGITSTAMATRVAQTGSVAFRVRATDRAGNVGGWSLGTTVRPRLRQQGSHTVHYRGTWRTSTARGYSGGSVKYAKARGAQATMTFTGRSIAFVTTRAVKRGKVRIYVNGRRVATIDLRRSSTLTRVVAWQRTWATTAKRTIRVVVVGTSGRPRVDADAFAILK
jgi:serine protease